MPTIKAVVFDIGGVVVGSPIVGVGLYEKAHNLPNHWINVAITAQGHNGAFQRLERGEISLDLFYQLFGEQLSETERNNEAYRRYCRKMDIKCPDKLPSNLKINGKELWTTMMEQASHPDPNVLTAINLLRRTLLPSLSLPLFKHSPPSPPESKRFTLAALTNNFIVPSVLPEPVQPRSTPVSSSELQDSILQASLNPKAAGAPTHVLRSLFDHFLESAVEGMRKPDERFFKLAVDRVGCKPEEIVFLDDIGLNLKAAGKLGINTIRVNPGKSMEAIKELEKYVGIPLRDGVAKL